MDRIAFAAMLLLALGLWVHPYLTGTSDPTGHPTASARSLLDKTNPTPPTPHFSQHVNVDPVSPQTFRGKQGFWRLAQTSSGVWWFVSPQDQPEFLNTVTTVQPYQLGRDHGGIDYVSHDYNAPAGNKGDLDAWAQKTIVRLKDMGFKGIGAWSNPVFSKYDFPMTRDLNVSGWSPTYIRKIYSPEWTSTIDLAVRTQVLPLKDNVNLVGYYLDNEVNWNDDGCGPCIYFDNLQNSDPNREEVVKVMHGLWKTVDAFNHDWNAQLKDWKDLDAWASLPREQPQAYAKLSSAWLSHMSEDYFRIATGLVRKYDPNHLILGVRFRGFAPREVVRSSRNYTDAQSINYYVADARLDEDMFKMMHDESGQPVIITEYSFHSLDGRSGDRDTVGFAGQVLDQQARADGYRLFTSRAARVPFIIGVDWFQWNDEPPSGRDTDGEDANFGMVDVDDRPYQLLADAVKETSPLLDPTHADSAFDSDTDVWRESFSQRPMMHVPYVGHSITLNGELSDWPLEARVQGIRHSQTVGLERSQLPLPNVYLGWSDEGLYMAMEVFDNDIQGAPAKGWWWTRDFAEFWISSKTVPADQNDFDVNCHQFFFVPNSWPGPDGLLGTIGEWHRDGDGLKDNIIPQSDIHQAVRILPDRYVVEMLIPAKVLNGFDPRHDSTIAFNIHVRNFQHAADYFWSAPKEVLTQQRPNTWGQLILDPPADAGGNVAQAHVPPILDLH